MAKTTRILFVTLLCLILAGTMVIASSFYKTIQKGVPNPLSDREFKKLESAALKDFTDPDVQRQLAQAYASTSEKMWAIIHGEAFCLLTTSDQARREMGAQVFLVFDQSLEAVGSSVSVSLYTQATTSGGIPFETSYEMAFLHGTMPFIMGGKLKPLTIAKLARIRALQVESLQKNMVSPNELLKWQWEAAAAGQFEAYNYWLFQTACPQEFEEWSAANIARLDSWQDWLAANPFRPKTPDFHRLYRQ